MGKVEEKKKRKVLITGSSGMLGTDLCQETSSDYELFGLDMVRGPQFTQGGKNFFKGDITDREVAIGIISGVKADVVIHAAAWTDVDGCELNPDKAYSVNGGGTENIALGCQKAGSILIYMSTDFVFDGNETTPYREDDKVKALSVYGASKLKGEEAIRNIVDRYFILRTSWLFGRNGRNFVDTILSKAKVERKLRVVDDQVGTPTYTKDLSKAIRVLLEKIMDAENIEEYSTRHAGIYHLSNSGSVSWYDYAKKIFELKNIEIDLEPISSEGLDRPARRPSYSILDNSKFVNLTGYEMRGWQDALEEYLNE